MSVFKRRRFPAEIILICVLVLQIRDQLPRPGRDDAGTRRRGRPYDDLPLGAALCAGDREAGPLVFLLHRASDRHRRRRLLHQ